MDTKLRGRVDGKMIVSENNNQMYIFSTTDIIGNKTLKDGDRVAFIAQGVRAIEIEKFDTTSALHAEAFSPKAQNSETSAPKAQTQIVSDKSTNAYKGAKVAGFEFMDNNTAQQRRDKKKNSLTQSYIANIKKYGVLSIILPIAFITAIYFFINELIDILKFALAQVNMLNDRFLIIAILAVFFLVILFTHIMPLNSAFKNFSYASKSTSILKQNVNYNMFFILAFLAVMGCVFFFGLENLLRSLEILGGIALLLLLSYFYKFKMFFKAGKISGVGIFYIAILVEFFCVAALSAMEILNAYKEFQLYTFGGIALSFVLYIIGYLMVTQIENDSRNIWNTR